MLELRLNFDQSDLPATGEYRRHLLARITPPSSKPPEDLPPLDLALVIDASGSMDGAPLDAAKQAAAVISQELDPSTRLTIVSFADDVVVHADSLTLDDAGRQAALRAVAAVHCRGTTDLHGGWQTGCTLLAEDEGCAAGRRRQVIVLSDGCANRGVVEPEQLALEARRMLDRGVTTSCVGVGDHYSPTQLSALAEHGGGACHDAEDPREIVEILLGEVRSLSDVVAEDVELVVTVPNGVRAAELSGLPSVFDGERLTVKVGALRGGRTREVVVRLGGDSGYWALTASAEMSWRSPGETTRQQVEASSATATPSLEPAALPTAQDARAMLVAWQADIVRWIASYNRDRNREAIRRLWRRDYEPFLAYASQLPETAEFQHAIRAIHAGSHREMSERSRKLSVDMTRKMARNEAAYYSGDKGSVAMQFDADRRRRSGGRR